MAIMGIAITAVLMAVLAYSAYLYIQNPDGAWSMASMGILSSSLMVFLVIFAVIYTRPSPSAEYAEKYQGICSVCGARFGPDGVCPKCGRRRMG